MGKIKDRAKKFYEDYSNIIWMCVGGTVVIGNKILDKNGIFLRKVADDFKDKSITEILEILGTDPNIECQVGEHLNAFNKVTRESTLYMRLKD